jgi:SAM-dependent methyltransferase
MLAEREGDPILEIGAGTGRVAIDLSKRGHRVTALDNDPGLLQALKGRADGLALRAVEADARSFELDQTFALCLVPMQTIQLLEGAAGRASLLDRARRHLNPGGLLAIAIAERLELYEVADGEPHPLPDVCERDGVLYASRPIAIRAVDGQLVIERRRETVDRDGRRAVEDHAIKLDVLSAAELEREALAAGLRPSDRATIAPTRDYAGSEVVILRA